MHYKTSCGQCYYVYLKAITNKGRCKITSNFLPLMKEHPRANPKRNKVGKLWPDIPSAVNTTPQNAQNVTVTGSL